MLGLIPRSSMREERVIRCLCLDTTCERRLDIVRKDEEGRRTYEGNGEMGRRFGSLRITL